MSDTNSGAFRSRSFAPDADAVEARFREHWGDHRVTSSSATMRDEIVGTPRFFLSRTEISGTIETQSANSVLSVAVAAGGYTWRSHDEAGDGAQAPFLARPGEGMHVLHSDVVVEAVSFDDEAFERMARNAYGDDKLRLRFESSVPLADARQKHLADIIRMTVASSGVVLESELVSTALHRLVAACVLDCFPLRGNPSVRERSARAQSVGYQRARKFMDDYASLPITIDDVAEAAGLPVKQLDAAFRWHSPTGGTVKDALRRVRLDAAHQDLVAGDPTQGDTVRGIALRWGFAPGRFATTYRSIHGVNPKWVLDR